MLASGGFQAASGVLLTKNPHYWGGPFGGVKVGSVEFPFAASSATVLSLLESDQIDWSGNFITGINQAFTSKAGHGNWGAPVNTNTLEPNLNKWPTNQLAVRQAISLAISRSAISKQGEDGQEAPATNASGLTLPLFASYITSNVKKSTLSSKAQPKAADAVLQKAGYKLDKKGYYALNGKEVKLDVTDPSLLQRLCRGRRDRRQGAEGGAHQRLLRRPDRVCLDRRRGDRELRPDDALVAGPASLRTSSTTTG